MPVGIYDRSKAKKNCIKVPLSKGKFALVDAYDYHHRVKKYKWFWDGHYANRTCHCEGKLNKHNIRLHRFILSAKEGEEVDHKNGDTLDCRRENLRICTSGQNNANSKNRKLGISGFRGAYKDGDRWVAHISFKGKIYHLETFKTSLEAAKAYDIKAKELFGEFATLNFP